MKIGRGPGAAFAFGAITLSLMGNAAYAQPDQSGKILPGRYIVVTRPGVNPADVVRGHGLGADRLYQNAINGFASNASAEQADKLRTDGRVQHVEPDREVTLVNNGTNPGKSGKGSGGTTPPPPGQKLPTGIDRVDAEENATAKIDGIDEQVNVDIAIIDTGIDLTHPDLNVVPGVTYVVGTKSPNDDNGHGTHVAGTCAARDNSIGVVGMAPGARVWPIKVLDRTGSGRLSDIIAGIDWVTARADRIEVANMSLGFSGSSAAFNASIARSVAAGITHVVAAGNSSRDAAAESPSSHPDVICVSAIADFDGKGGGLGQPTCRADVDDTFADFSNYGQVVDIAAPGVCILSTWKGGGYNTISGTSMAAPHVTGAAALYKASNPTATPAQVKAGLLNDAKAQVDPPSPEHYFGFSGDPDQYAEPVLYGALF